MIHTTHLKVDSLGSNGYPYVELHMTDYDAVNGVSIMFKASALVAAGVVVKVVGRYTCEESPLAEATGNTHYSVNAGAAAKKHLGDLTFDFSTYLENKLDFKPGTVIGAVTFPAILPPVIGFLFTNVDVSLNLVTATRRLNPAGA